MLLLASESKDPKQITSSVKQVVKNCTFDKLNIETLSTVDLEYLFLNIRARSVGETASPNIKCSKCNGTVPITVDLSEVTVNTTNIPDRKIQLTNSVGVVMRFPDYHLIEEANGETPDQTKSIEMVASCVERIYDEKNVYETKDFTKKEVIDFVESLTQSSFVKIVNFFQKIPKMEKEVSYKCPTCNNEGKITLSGLQDFFT